MKLDTTCPIETPEGVLLELRIAGPVVRALAWAIDFAIRWGIYIILGNTLGSFMGRYGMGLFLIMIFLIEWFYPVLFEIYQHGATPGKKVMGIAVLHDDGTPVGWPAALTRNLLRAVDFLPLLYGFGLMSMLLNRDFKRLGDLAAGTVVVHRLNQRKRQSLPAESPTPPGVALTEMQQQAVIEYASRLSTLTPERAEELAAIVAPVTRASGEVGVRKLVAIANWLVGKR